jgi:hypothetical protein
MCLDLNDSIDALGGDLERAACAQDKSGVGESKYQFLSRKVTAFPQEVPSNVKNYQ